jgi:hypothetical protein
MLTMEHVRRVLERIGAAIRRINAVEREVAASLTRCLTIAFDLPPFALIAMPGCASANRVVQRSGPCKGVRILPGD